jgi:hypothetical protein
MLYFECDGGQYYAGQLGTASRHETPPGNRRLTGADYFPAGDAGS